MSGSASFIRTLTRFNEAHARRRGKFVCWLAGIVGANRASMRPTPEGVGNVYRWIKAQGEPSLQ